MSKSDIRVAIVGSSGRMGRELIKAVSQQKGIILGAALKQKGSSIIGTDAGKLVGIGNLNVIINDDIINVLDKFDILIDFTHPKCTEYYLSICKKNNKAIIIGTTGFSKTIQQKINKAAKKIPIVLSSNFSIGVNLVLKLLEKTAKVIGLCSDIQIIEAHHRYKVDSPSGTALAMKNIISKSIKYNLKKYKSCNKKNISYNMENNNIGLTTIRAGDILGEHTVIFADIGERIEIIHKTSSRIIFAKGAIKACLWLKGKKNGLYSMEDVLNI
ncbi:MAG: 4-hydroxy-tetrahydrodipicolinate reductase [Arsenophonus endosymbiont of Ceratovacuna japonica]